MTFGLLIFLANFCLGSFLLRSARLGLWIGLVTVTADKAWLQKTPDARSTRGAYIVKGDVVGVLAFKDGAAKVEFIDGDNRSFMGWIGQDQYARVKRPGG